jgi:hypothetical protein
LSELRNALGGRDRASMQINWQPMIEQDWGCNWRPSLSELRDGQGGSDLAWMEMNLHPVIERDWRTTWRRSIWREARRLKRLYPLDNL